MQAFTPRFEHTLRILGRRSADYTTTTPLLCRSQKLSSKQPAVGGVFPTYDLRRTTYHLPSWLDVYYPLISILGILRFSETALKRDQERE
jgi:hypothetical protein